MIIHQAIYKNHGGGVFWQFVFKNLVIAALEKS